MRRVVVWLRMRFAGLWPAFGLLLLVAWLAGSALALGGGLVARGRHERSLVPTEAGFLVVVRASLAEAAREALVALPDVRVDRERRIEDLLPGASAAPARLERLRVFEVAVALSPVAAGLGPQVEAMQAVDGVVDVIEDGADGRTRATPERARRTILLGAILVAGGLTVLGFALFRIAWLAARERREEISVRHLLGADPLRIWAPLALVLTAATVVGLSAGLVCVRVAIAALQGGPAGATEWPGARELAISVVAGFGLLLVAGASAALAARRAVSGVARAAIVARLALLLALASALPASATVSPEDFAGDRQSLRALSHELAVARRALHRSERALVETERVAIRAAASGSEIQTRLAAARREADLIEVERWREARDGLLRRRGELRELLRASRAPAPPIQPRIAPIYGRLTLALARRFGEPTRDADLRPFRDGLAIRTRPGEVLRSVAPGRVVFSGELAGMGEVVVVSHGRRTYSIYGRAEALVVRGMQVVAGEVIARAPEEPALVYFAIREGRRPVDPLVWLREGEEPPATGRSISTGVRKRRGAG